MVWEPQPSGLVQLKCLLNELQSGANQAEASGRQILQRLDAYRAFPDFNNYLAFIFARGEDAPVEIRQSAGLLLKNNLRQQFAVTPDELKQSIKDSLLHVLPHPQKPLRHTAGTCISTVVSSSGIASWPQLVAALLQCLQSDAPHMLDGGLDSLYKIIEDAPFEMEAKMLDGRYLHSLFAMAHDASFAVRREVCAGLVQLLTVQPDRLQPHLYQVIEYMLQCNEVEDEGVALESCEFWMGFCEAHLDPQLLLPYLGRLIPMLMKNMVYEEHDEDVQDAEAAEAPVTREEKDSELRPMHHKQKEHGATPEEGEEDEGDDDDEVESRWNLRKCSAAGLDRLSNVYGNDLLPVLMPIVEQRLQDPNWRARESAILALGAVAEGCHTGLEPYLGNMVTLLLPRMADPRPMVRIITCWALSRYAYWLLAGACHGVKILLIVNGARHQMLDAVVGLIRCMLDHNRFVQEAAVSGLANVIETAGQEDAMRVLEPYLRPIVDVIATAIQQYGRRNLRLAYDTLGMLSEAAGSRLGDPTLVAVFMPPLYARLSSHSPHDRDLIPLLECLTMSSWCSVRHSAAATYGRASEQARLVGAAMSLLAAQQHVHTAAASGAAPAAEYDRDLVVSALDLISGLAEGLGPSIDPLVASSPLPQVILAACTDESPDLRQSGFALVGDLARCCISHLTPLAPHLLTAALAALMPQQLVQANMKACNNACWSLGEMCLKLSPSLVAECAQSAANRMAYILALPVRLPRSLVENAAIALGRLSMMAPALVAPHLPHFFVPWCQALRSVRDDVEKEHGFLGLCALLRH
ncbi:ARM repeat-containing protein, partial [Dunaliella salina]